MYQPCASLLQAFVVPAASLQIEYPMMFKLDNRRGGRHTHCGVLEFIADEGLVYMPYWVSPPASAFANFQANSSVLMRGRGFWLCVETGTVRLLVSGCVGRGILLAYQCKTVIGSSHDKH